MTDVAGAAPQSYGHYDVESVLGRGAMGMVYLARDRRIGRRVALKTVHVNEKFDDASEASEFYRRLQREAELCGALQHPNIVTLYEPGYENDVIAWLATEYIDGENLRERMRRQKPLPLPEAMHILEGILRGLAYAHAKGIVHRDIKPANILLTTSGDAKIADFGIARPVDSNLTAVGEMLGTPSYMSPEQVKCQPVTVRSDLFSVGALLYEMLTGLKPFAASDVTGILRNVVELTPRPMHAVQSELPEDLSAFTARLLAKRPEERYQSAIDALDELHRIIEEIPTLEPLGPERPAPFAAAPLPAARDWRGTQPALSPLAEDISEVTTALGGRPGRLDKIVPAAVFWTVIAVAVAVPAGIGISIRAGTDATPTMAYSPAQLRALAVKKQQLRAARALLLAGKFDEGITAYRTYLARYPNSVVARNELAEARAALARSTAARARVTVTGSKSRVEPQKEAPPEQPPRRSLFRRIFHIDPPKDPSKDPPKKP